LSSTTDEQAPEPSVRIENSSSEEKEVPVTSSFFELADYASYLDSVGISQKTKAWYLKGMRAFLMRAKDLKNPNEYNEYIMKMGVRRGEFMTRAMLKHYVKFKYSSKKERETRDNILDAISMIRIKAKSMKRKVHVLDEKKVLEIVGNIRHANFRVVALLQYALGIRAADVLRIKYSDVQYEPYKGDTLLTLFVTGKGEKRFKMWVFDKGLQRLVEERLSSPQSLVHDYVFMRDLNNSRKIPASDAELVQRMIDANYNVYMTELKLALMRTGVSPKDWATHDFRRNMARRVWAKYKDIILLKEVLHHEDINTTVRYLQTMGLRVQGVLEEVQQDLLK